MGSGERGDTILNERNFNILLSKLLTKFRKHEFLESVFYVLNKAGQTRYTKFTCKKCGLVMNIHSDYMKKLTWEELHGCTGKKN